MAVSKTVKKDGYGKTYIKKRKTKVGDGGQWPEKKRLEVVTTMMATGSPTITEAMTGVPYQTFRHWRQQQWWKDYENELQNAEDLQLSAQLKKVVDKSLDVVADRLENGDFQYDPKTGQMIRVPVKMRDTHKVLADTIDKRMLLQKRPTKITEQQQTVDDRLANLASQFAAFVSGNKQQPEIIDGRIVEVVEDAVYEERETGLQGRAELGAHQEEEQSEGQS